MLIKIQPRYCYGDWSECSIDSSHWLGSVPLPRSQINKRDDCILSIWFSTSDKFTPLGETGDIWRHFSFSLLQKGIILLACSRQRPVMVLSGLQCVTDTQVFDHQALVFRSHFHCLLLYKEPANTVLCTAQ